MRQKRGDIWEVKADAIVVTTNGIVTDDGRAVMGGGTALQAAERFPSLPKRLATEIRREGNHVYVFGFIPSGGPMIVTMPTKGHFNQPSSLDLIERSCEELVATANLYDWKRIVLPRPGCGLGQLQWKEVWPVIAPILDDRFIVMSP